MFAKYLIKEGAIFKSLNDKKNYKLITLVNGLRALLISDPSYSQANVSRPSTPSTISSSEESQEDESELADGEMEEHDKGIKVCGAALSVRAGSLNDPFHVQGLAHLVEHVVFMGNTEYPEGNSFDSFLSKRSGYNNAHTDCEMTVYEFQVPNRHLQESLKRFAWMFISPLLQKSSIESEMRPVNNEFVDTLSDDEIRTEHLIASFALPGHDLSKFGYGNNESLIERPLEKGIDLHKEVVDFWTKYYHASNMNLVVQGEYELETLEKWVAEYFSKIPKTPENYHPFVSRFKSTDDFPYDESKFCKLYYVDPVSSGDFFYINFWCPPKFNDYLSKPLSCISSLIGHEGKGSLLSVFKKKGYALELLAGNEANGFDCNRYQSLLTIQLKLTPLGLNNLDTIIDYLWSYIDDMRTLGTPKKLLEEDMALRGYLFGYANEKTGARNCVKIADNMTVYDEEHIITGPKLLFKIDEEMIKSAFSYIVPARANYMILSKQQFNAKDLPVQSEHWYGTKYKAVEIPDRWINYRKPVGYEKEIHFPRENNFIAENFSIVKQTSDDSFNCDLPVNISENLKWRLWYKEATKYGVPKGCVNMIFRSPIGRSNPLITAALDVFVRALVMKTEEDIYPASLAGFRYYIVVHESGLLLSFSGFNDKLPQFISLVIDHLINLDLDELTFNDVRRDIFNCYHDTFNDISELSKSVRLSILCTSHWTPLMKRTYLPQLTREMVISCGQQLLGSLFLECLVTGNITSEEATAIVTQTAEKINYSPLYHYSNASGRVCQLPHGHHICRVLAFNREDKSSLVTNYYQFNPVDVRSSVLTELLSSAMSEPLFDCLRTQEGLGYYVHNSNHITGGVGGFSVSVLSDSSKFDCSFIDSRIENFLANYSKSLLDMTEEEFYELVKGLIKVKSTPFITLKEETLFFWSEVTESTYRFDRRLQEISALNRLSLAEFVTWSILHLQDSASRKKLSIQIVGNGPKAIDECIGLSFNPFLPQPVQPVQSDNHLTAGLVDCNSINGENCSSPLIAGIDTDNFESNHECSLTLDSRKKRSAASFEAEEDKVYVLKYLAPKTKHSEAKLITNIEQFRKDLFIYPKIRMVNAPGK